MASETAKALANEANEDTTVKVAFRGRTFSVEKEVQDWDIDALEAHEEGNLTLFLRGLLGPVQWAEVKSLRLKVRDLDELSDAVLRSMGLSSEKSDS